MNWNRPSFAEPTEGGREWDGKGTLSMNRKEGRLLTPCLRQKRYGRQAALSSTEEERENRTRAMSPPAIIPFRTRNSRLLA